MNSIFVTGGMGFVGSNFLKKIDIEQIEQIFLLIRDEERFENFKKNLPTNLKNKINPLKGSIDQENFSLTKKNIDNISKEVRSVFHIAAEVNHLKTHSQLYSTNVKPIETITKLFKEKQPVINFISTLGAANKKNKLGFIDEDFITDEPILEMGYLESKKQAEIKITNLKDSFDFNIFRLGYISSNTKNGECLYENNQFMLFIKGCIQLKCFPKINRVFNLTPVDFVADFMSLNDFLYKGEGVFNLFNYSELIKIDELFQYLIKRGFFIECVSMEEWQNRLKKSGRNNALFRFLLYYRKKNASSQILRFGKNIQEYSFSKVKEKCLKNNTPPPLLKYKYLDTIFNHLIKVGFIDIKV